MKLRPIDVMVRAVQRGYSLDEVRPCFVKSLGGGWFEVDTNHESYPSRAKEGYSPPAGIRLAATEMLAAFSQPDGNYTPMAGAGGVGSELKKLLSSIGIRATPNCSCATRAREMDQRGVEWCEQNIDTIVGWLREEANKRSIPFIDAAGRILVRRSIVNARRAASV